MTILQKQKLPIKQTMNNRTAAADNRDIELETKEFVLKNIISNIV